MMEAERTRIEFKTKDKDDKEVELEVRKPSNKVFQNAQMVYASAWQKAINNDPPLLLRAKLDKVLRQQGLWNDDKETQSKDLLRKIRDHRLTLGRGGISADKAVELYIDIVKLQTKLNKLLAERNRLDANTAEAIADNAQFNFLVSESTFYALTGARYFHSYEDYMDRSSEQASRDAATKLMILLYDVDEDADKHRPEVILLKKLGRMDDEGNLLKNGKLVDIDGRYVNDKGQYVDEHGNLVDEDGIAVDKYGFPLLTDTKPFVDENGKLLEIDFAVK